MFGLGKSDKKNHIWQILDSLYRISEQEAQELLNSLFHIKIIAGVHVFKVPTSKIGSEGLVILVSKPVNTEFEGKILYARGPISLHRQDEECALFYKSKTEEFEVHFEGQQEAITYWCRELKCRAETYASIFLYIFNRNRAASFLERARDELKQAKDDLERQNETERDFLNSLFEDFRLKEGPHVALQKIADMTLFDWAIISVYGPMTKKLLPIYSSQEETFLNIEAFSTEQLPAFEEIVNRNTVVMKTVRSIKDRTCLFELMYSKGARQAGFLRFGYDPRRQGLPRGVLCLYRRKEGTLEPRHRVLLGYAAREVAAWMDERDENIENDIIEAAIKHAERECGNAAVVSVNERIFERVLMALGRSINLCLGKYFSRSLTGDMRCGFVVDEKTVGDVPSRMRQSVAEFLQEKESGSGSFYIMDAAKGLCSVVTQDGPMAFVSSSEKESLTVLRPHIYEWLFLLMKLVYQLVIVEKKRLAGMQRTVHLIRAPLQGFIPMISEIRRFLNDTNVSRRDIDKYAEDMEQSMMRLKMLLHIFNSIMGIKAPRPNLRPILIENSVLRPMRRLLSAHARKRNVSLSETYGFDIIPVISSDPDLLSLIFYNLVV